MEKKSKKDIKRNEIFNNFMEENFPIAYKLNKLGYNMIRKEDQSCQTKSLKKS